MVAFARREPPASARAVAVAKLEQSYARLTEYLGRSETHPSIETLRTKSYFPTTTRFNEPRRPAIAAPSPRRRPRRLDGAARGSSPCVDARQGHTARMRNESAIVITCPCPRRRSSARPCSRRRAPRPASCPDRGEHGRRAAVRPRPQVRRAAQGALLQRGLGVDPGVRRRVLDFRRGHQGQEQDHRPVRVLQSWARARAASTSTWPWPRRSPTRSASSGRRRRRARPATCAL